MVTLLNSITYTRKQCYTDLQNKRRAMTGKLKLTNWKSVKFVVYVEHSKLKCFQL